MPLFGLKGLIACGASIDIALGVGLIWMVSKSLQQRRFSMALSAGGSFAMKGLTDYAVAYFAGALELKPDNARYHYNLALAYR